MYGVCSVCSPRGARRERRGYGLDDTEDGASRLKHLRLDPSDRSAPLGGLIILIKKRGSLRAQLSLKCFTAS